MIDHFNLIKIGQLKTYNHNLTEILTLLHYHIFKCNTYYEMSKNAPNDGSNMKNKTLICCQNALKVRNISLNVALAIKAEYENHLVIY